VENLIIKNNCLFTILSATNPTCMDGPVFETRSVTESPATNRVNHDTTSGHSE